MFSDKKKIKTKKWHVAIVILIIAGVIGLKIYSYIWPKVNIKIGNQIIKVLVADTQARRIEGWSNKENMGDYQGMLFPFLQSGAHTMVMRDMRFPLDIVWLSNGEIVDMAPNVAPEPGLTEAQLTPYFARLPSNAVLELSAGFIDKNGLRIGGKIEIVK